MTVADDPIATPGETPATTAATHPSFLRWLAELVLMIGLAFILAAVVRTFVVQPFMIPTTSMVPTIEIGERVLANKFIYRFEAPKAGDVVVFDDPTGTVQTLIKRVVAVGGQTVDLVDGKVVVDGVPLDEPYTYGKPSEPGPVAMPYDVPRGAPRVMGDNPPTTLGGGGPEAVPLDRVRGKAFVRYWPLSRIDTL
jgi:signal peptidase I